MSCEGKSSVSLKFWGKAIQAGLIGVLMLVVGMAWAVATPPMSGADDDYHLTSVACAQGDSQFCTKISESVALVPKTLTEAPCYIKDRSRGADCFRWVPELVETSRWNSTTSYRSSLFYDSMSLLLGSDLWRSIISMRLANVVLASVLFSFALVVAMRRVRIALAFSILAVFLPIGAFHIASNNPTAWAVIGVGTFWAYLMTVWSSAKVGHSRRIAAGLGAVLAGILALAGRPDSAVYLAASVIAVALLRWSYLKNHLLLLLPIPILLAASLFLARTRILASLGIVGENFPNIAETFWQWWPRFHVLEWPLLMSYVFGGSTPLYMPYPLSYTSGVGWDSRAGTPLEFPSLVGLAALLVVISVVWMGLTHYSWRKMAAISVVFSSIVVMSLGYVWFTSFSVWAQARYYVGPMILLIGLASFMPKSTPPLRAAQITLLGIAASVSAIAALSTVMRSTTNGQALAPDVAWSVYEAYVQWWWTNLNINFPLSPTGVVLIGSTGIVLLVAGLLLKIQWEFSSGRNSHAEISWK